MLPRFEYSFVRLALKSGFFSGKSLSTDYQQVIRERANDGWKLVDIFSPAVAGYGRSTHADLIFERPLD